MYLVAVDMSQSGCEEAFQNRIELGGLSLVIEHTHTRALPAVVVLANSLLVARNGWNSTACSE